MQRAARIAYHVVEHCDASLIDSIDRDAEDGELRPGDVDLEIGNFGAAAAERHETAARWTIAIRYHLDRARGLRRLECPHRYLSLQCCDRAVARRQMVVQQQRHHGEDEGETCGTEQHGQPLPPGFGPDFPRWCVTTGLEQPQRGMDALGQADLIEHFGMLAAVTLEILRALERQSTREVALNDLIARDEVWIHDRCSWGGYRW